MKKTTFTALIIVFFSFSLFAQKSESSVTDEEYALLSTILSGSSVIVNKTIYAQIFKDNGKDDPFDNSVSLLQLKEMMPDLSEETVKDFNLKNGREYVLEKKFNLKGKYELLNRDVIDKFFYEAQNSEKGWENFRKEYPKSGGYVRFSRIGFSPDKKQAIIFFSHFCGSLCASGDFIFYIKEKDKWIEKAKVNIWVS